MKRTTIFLTNDLERLLQETARRTHRPQAEIVRDALSQYLWAQPRPWPRSIGIGSNGEPAVTSENVKEWVRERWRQELDEADHSSAARPRAQLRLRRLPMLDVPGLGDPAAPG